MTIFTFIAGFFLILIILWDVFETIILPRRVTRRIRLMNIFYTVIWVPWSTLVKRVANERRHEKYLGLFGPLSLLLLLIVWAAGLIVGYALLFWATGAKLSTLGESTFTIYLYLSGVTFFTLGYGDVTPLYGFGRFLVVIEGGNGLGLFAIVISYLPILYQAFSRREASISLLDARAGSPSSAVELLRRHRAEDSFADLNRLLSEWERWSAELLESHLSYPVLCYFRSQHDNQSWLRALTTVLDTCALVIVGVDNAPVWQARMTFAMARHAVVDIAQVFRTAPSAPSSCSGRLTSEELRRLRDLLRDKGIEMADGDQTEKRLCELRMMYEPYVFALADWLLMPLPPWILPPDAIDNWKTSAWGRIQ
ncbi:MAG: potassium channel family protein [Pyrinomonadaceae bacterium]